MVVRKSAVCFVVMPGLGPGIHLPAETMDCRVKPGNGK
jgi:hypothetical protein